MGILDLLLRRWVFTILTTVDLYNTKRKVKSIIGRVRELHMANDYERNVQKVIRHEDGRRIRNGYDRGHVLCEKGLRMTQLKTSRRSRVEW